MDILSLLLASSLSISSRLTPALEPPPLSIQIALQRKVSEEIVPEVITLKEEPKPNPILCSCVLFLKNKGHAISGDAINLESNIPLSQTTVGDLILFTHTDKAGNSVGHVAEILAFKKDGWLVDESNFKPCEKTKRIVAYNNPFIKGFLRA